MTPNRIFIIFLDGVGLGDNNAEANPFVKYPPPFLSQLMDNQPLIQPSAGYANKQATLLGLDATLSVAGLPQSGTGQTAILSGQNAPAILGQHTGPYPNKQLKELLAQNSLFKQTLAQNIPTAYANAYPNQFLERLERGKGRLSANTRAALLAGLKLRGAEDLLAGRAVSALLTNRYWQEWGYPAPQLTPQQAGQQLINLGDDHKLVYFEFWYTDVVGHKQNMAQADEILTLLDGFLAGAIKAINLKEDLLLVISDHGNFEDLSTKQHTLNPAFTLAVGAGHQQAGKTLHALTDITPFVLGQISP